MNIQYTPGTSWTDGLTNDYLTYTWQYLHRLTNAHVLSSEMKDADVIIIIEFSIV